jgi:hypothetical protein
MFVIRHSLTPIRAALIHLLDFKITSFNETNLIDKHPHNQRARGRYLPIKPSDPHPDLGTQLELSHGQRMDKNSYIKIEGHFSAPLEALRPYGKSRCPGWLRLSPESFQTLVAHAGYQCLEPAMAMPAALTPIRTSYPPVGFVGRTQPSTPHSQPTAVQQWPPPPPPPPPTQQGQRPEVEAPMSAPLYTWQSARIEEERRRLVQDAGCASHTQNRHGYGTIWATSRTNRGESWPGEEFWLDLAWCIRFIFKWFLVIALLGAVVYGIHTAVLTVITAVVDCWKWAGELISGLVRDISENWAWLIDQFDAAIDAIRQFFGNLTVFAGI